MTVEPVEGGSPLTAVPTLTAELREGEEGKPNGG